jgi:Ca2+-binding RTX toxin-like protein
MAMAIRNGTAGNDTLNGTSLDDSFFSGDGDDTMFGGAGNDTFYASAGQDFMFGGSGSDTVDYSAITEQPSFLGFNGVYVVLQDGWGGEMGASAPDYYSSIENVTGSNFNDAIQGDGNANVIRGLAGDDFIEGMGGADTLEGGTGNDGLIYTHSNARVVVDLLNNTASGGHAAGDVISGFENLAGSDFNDILSGTNGANILEGGDGNDTINGRGGNDTIRGGDGNDILTGGSGADTFVYYENFYSSGTDRITDFNVHSDTIRFDVDGNGANVNISVTNLNLYSFTADVVITLENTRDGDPRTHVSRRHQFGGGPDRARLIGGEQSTRPAT